MEQIFKQLQGIILLALPTTFLVLLLHFYLKKVLFLPMERVLDERSRRTVGTVSDSEELVRQAAEKMKSYDAALAAARADLYREFEVHRGRLSATQASALKEARDVADRTLAAAKAEISAEAEEARTSLSAEVSRLADEIAANLLAKGAKS